MSHHRVGLTRQLEQDGVTDPDAFLEAILAHVDRGHDLPDGATPRECSVVAYVLKLTRTPGAMEQADVAALRSAGLDDAEILDVVHVAGYYAYANRLADGLGLMVEPYRSQ